MSNQSNQQQPLRQRAGNQASPASQRPHPHNQPRPVFDLPERPSESEAKKRLGAIGRRAKEYWFQNHPDAYRKLSEQGVLNRLLFQAESNVLEGAAKAVERGAEPEEALAQLEQDYLLFPGQQESSDLEHEGSDEDLSLEEQDRLLSDESDVPADLQSETT